MGLVSKRDYDPVTQITETFHFDEVTEDVYIEKSQVVDDVTDLTKAQFNSTDERAPWGEMAHVARIPNVILEAHPELMHDTEALNKWLNDPDNRMFRSRPGRI